jgi:hypothetical protein
MVQLPRWITDPGLAAVTAIIGTVATVFAAFWGVYVYYKPPPDLPAKPIASESVAENGTPTANRTLSLDNLNGAWVGVSHNNICHKISQTGRSLSVQNYNSYGEPIHESGSGVVKENPIVVIHMRKQNGDETRVSMKLRPPSQSEDAWHLVDTDQGNDWTYVGDDCPKAPLP